MQSHVCGRPPELVTKEEVDLERERVKAVDARPIKKVAEAKNRKRKRLQVSSLACMTHLACMQAGSNLSAAEPMSDQQSDQAVCGWLHHQYLCIKPLPGQWCILVISACSSRLNTVIAVNCVNHQTRGPA